MIGTFAALFAQRHPEEMNSLNYFAYSAGVRPQIRVTGDAEARDIRVRSLVAPNEQFVFVSNPGEHMVRPTIELPMPFAAGEARDLMADRRIDLHLNKQRASFGKWLHAGETWVIKISAAEGEK